MVCVRLAVGNIAAFPNSCDTDISFASQPETGLDSIARAYRGREGGEYLQVSAVSPHGESGMQRNAIDLGWGRDWRGVYYPASGYCLVKLRGGLRRIGW